MNIDKLTWEEKYKIYKEVQHDFDVKDALNVLEEFKDCCSAEQFNKAVEEIDSIAYSARDNMNGNGVGWHDAMEAAIDDCVDRYKIQDKFNNIVKEYKEEI